MMIMLVFKVMKRSVTVWNKALVVKDDERIVVLMVALMMSKVLILKTTTVVFVMIPSKVKTPNTNENIN